MKPQPVAPPGVTGTAPPGGISSKSGAAFAAPMTRAAASRSRVYMLSSASMLRLLKLVVDLRNSAAVRTVAERHREARTGRASREVDRETGRCLPAGEGADCNRERVEQLRRRGAVSRCHVEGHARDLGSDGRHARDL